MVGWVDKFYILAVHSQEEAGLVEVQPPRGYKYVRLLANTDYFKMIEFCPLFRPVVIARIGFLHFGLWLGLLLRQGG